MMRSLLKTSSSRNAVTASLSFRKIERDGERYRFFASCWVTVLAPRCPPARHASCNSMKSIPWCVLNRESSAMMIMRSRSAGGWADGLMGRRSASRPIAQSLRNRIIAVHRGS